MADRNGAAALQRLPAVGSLLGEPALAALVARHGRAVVADAARSALDAARVRIRERGELCTVGPDDVARALESLTRRSLRRVINATGVLLHTNLGRAPLALEAQEALLDVARGYSTVELDLATGERGDRHRHVSALVAALTGAEGGLVFNNNAGAMMIMLAALCRGREVIVARGELVEIGGGFRVPDVMMESGATLVEVGTTNKVYDRDYAAAITERTAAILQVHRSNFAIVGFTHEPGIRALAEVAHGRGLPLLVDLGSGLLAGEEELGPGYAEVRAEPRPQELVKDGADLVAFSGDKLLGGPQAGIVAGRAPLLERLRKHPLARALRADKLTLAALEATLRLYAHGQAARVPTVQQLAEPLERLAARAERVRARIGDACPGLALDVVRGDSVAGGGSLPLARFPSQLVLVGAPGEAARALSARLRAGEPAIVTRMVEDRVAFDVRTIAEEDVFPIGGLVAAAWAGGGGAETSKEEASR